jgi:hypothetical protein
VAEETPQQFAILLQKYKKYMQKLNEINKIACSLQGALHKAKCLFAQWKYRDRWQDRFDPWVGR